MFRSLRLGSLFVALALAVVPVFESIRDAIGSFVQACTRFVLRGVEIIARRDTVPLRPVVNLVQAKAFVQRIMKRERPVMTVGWRMCPSV